ncbi:MAG: hypothetical protein IJU03_11550 [Thermoguttaceae bacterium]|nr:hypothetical protein [Thermoguttaceae bacterium]
MVRYTLILVLCNLIVNSGSLLIGQTDGLDGLTKKGDSQIVDSEEASAAHIQQDSDSCQQFDFDEDFIEHFIDYRLLIEDRLDFESIVNEARINRIKHTETVSNLKKYLDIGKFYNETLKMLNEEKYSDAISRTKNAIKNYLNEKTPLNRPPWEDDIPIESKRGLALPVKYPMNLERYIQLLGLAYELSGNYNKAERSYDIVYGTNEVALNWTKARLLYERNNRRRSFVVVCGFLQQYYNLTPQSVDNVIERVKSAELKWKDDQDAAIYVRGGVPVDLDEQKYRDVEAVELYRIRDWCARFICPNLVYKKLSFSSESTRQERVESVKFIRECYAQFMDFMEQEYELMMADEDVAVLFQRSRFTSNTVKDEFADAMTLLRKIKELPY